MTPENKAQVVAAAPSTPAAPGVPTDRLLRDMAARHGCHPDNGVTFARAVLALAPTGGEVEQLQTDDRPPGWPEGAFFTDGEGGFYDENAEPLSHLAASQSVRTSGEALGTVPSAQGWMPIETAPKDGTEILAWREDCGVMLARYTCADALSTTTDKDRDELDDESLFKEDWFGGDSELGGYRLEGSEVPTFWRPLPPDPSSLAAASPEVLPASPDVQDPSDGGNQQ